MRPRKKEANVLTCMRPVLGGRSPLGAEGAEEHQWTLAHYDPAPAQRAAGRAN
jgi:hypothetical protein